MKQTLSKTERLCGRPRIRHVLEQGRRFHIPPLRVSWVITPYTGPAVSIVFSVPKSRFRHAVDRNLLKRRMREAYRTQKADLAGWAAENGLHLDVILSYNGREISDSREIREKIILILQRLRVACEKTAG